MKSIAQLFAEVANFTVKYDTYFDIYAQVLERFRGKDIVFVEIGILGGGSLEAWRAILGPGARIIGVDANPVLEPFLEAKGFEVFIGDQADPEFWKGFFAEVGPVDIVLDDGGHTYKQQITTFDCVIEHVNDGGILLTEDCHTSYMSKFGYPSKHTFIEFSKHLVDALGSRYFGTPPSGNRRHTAYAALVHSVQFFESIVVFHVDRQRCVRPTRVSYGSAHGHVDDARALHEEEGAFLSQLLRRLRLQSFVPGRIQRQVARLESLISYRLENRSLSRYF
jgi:hypothetical protein